MFWKKPDFEIDAIFPHPKRPDVPPPAPGLKFGAPREIISTPVAQRRAAFVVVHGMGQQVPYETISMLAECMVQEEKKTGKYQKPPAVSVERVKITDNPADPPLCRAKFTVKRDVNGEEVLIDVHIYEGYWAPLTEGKVTLFETISFLFSAVGNGILTGLRGAAFKRWMFGDFRDLPIKGGTAISLLIAAVAFVAAWIPAIIFGFKWRALLAASSLRAALGDHMSFSIFSLALLGLYAWIFRYFIVEYVGDVAIYISAYKVSKFEETRVKIQQAVFSVLRQVYSSRVGGGESANTYDTVVLVGHSLGSVIAYDALNDAICWDQTDHAGRLNVVARTRSLITFGSPLDKTAFLFRTQVSGPRYLREALAAQKQPLILDYKHFRPRTFHWVNIYSHADIISGRLQYYDLPKPASSSEPDFNPIVNKPDPAAWIPFYAHVQYWNNKALHTQLFDAME
jgi:hypothetical protein